MMTHLKRAGLLAAVVALCGAPTAHAASSQGSDAQYTILCQQFTGPTHAQAAKQAKEALVKATKLKDWYVVTGDTDSTLYYGFYKSFDNPKDADTVRAQNDRKTLAAMTDTAGNKPFQYCVFVAAAGADPTAPAEWDLRNAKGYFSLAIAAYMDSPLRKQYAVDAVREARKRGIPAFYFHGDTVSEVCIGAWPRDAVKEQESSEGRSTDPNQPLLVSTTPLPASMKNLREKESGQKVKVMAPDFQPVDPSLMKMMKDYPFHSINGETTVRKYTKDGQTSEIQDPSFLVYIPQKDEEVVKQDPVLEQKAVELGVAPQSQYAPKKGAGQLKSIGQ